MTEIEISLIAWLSTFNITTINIIDDIKDGTIIANILMKISPINFNTIDINKSTNPVIIASNLRQLLRHIIDYYESNLLKYIDTSHIDIDIIIKGDYENSNLMIINFIEILIN